MRRGRLVSALLIVVGLALGEAGHAPAVRPAMSAAGYLVLAGDFHVHSFPGDGLLPPWDLAVEAQRRHLDVIGLTNHNSMLSWHVAQAVPWHPAGAMLMRGVEVTAVGYHVAAIGVDAPINWRQSVASAAADIHAHGGVAIAAHPVRDVRDRLHAYDEAALDALDGVEAAHPIMSRGDTYARQLADFYTRAIARHPSIAAIGSTDFHHTAPIGLCRTYLFTRGRTSADVLDAIRSGRTVACDGLGEAYGPSALVGLVAETCRRDAAAPPEGDVALTRAGACCAWLGVLALVALGAAERD